MTCSRRVRAAAAALLGAACLAASPAHAQMPALARLEGHVTDSVHARPLAHVPVQAIRRAPEPTLTIVETDDAGRFRFDSLVPGRYGVSVIAPLLDSLDLVAPEVFVDVAAGAKASVDLALPSGTTLRAAACPGMQLARGHGAVVGSATDASTDLPLTGAMVVVGWTDLSVDQATRRVSSVPRTGAVPVDSLGTYRLCGVPTDVPLVLQLQRGTVTGSAVDAMVDDSIGVLRRNLSLADGDGTARDAVAARDTVPQPATSGTATISGVVVGTGEQPVPDAQVRIANARSSARTDSLGRFTLSGLPAGTQMLEARRIGYLAARVPVELRSGQAVSRRVVLTRAVSLDSVRIIAMRSRYPEMEQRRRRGLGRFLDQSDIEKRNPFQTSDLLRMMPGFRVVGDGLDSRIISTRGHSGFSGPCETNVVIDGMQHMDIGMVHPADIAGIELYRGPGEAPIQYDSRCGVIVIWTKR